MPCDYLHRCPRISSPAGQLGFRRVGDPGSLPWQCCGELRSSFLQGWMCSLVSLISNASAWTIKVPVLHDMLCGCDMNLCQTSNKHDCV